VTEPGGVAGAPHRIRRQRWRVVAPSRAEGFALRRRLRGAWAETLPVFESAFDRAVAADVVVYVSRLELRVRVRSEEELVDALPRLLAAQLREQLGAVAETPAPPAAEAVWTRASLEADTLELLWPYLHTGRLAWHRFNDERESLSRALTRTAIRDRDRVIGRLTGLATLDHAGAGAETGLFAALFRWLQLLPESEWAPVARIFADRLFGEPTPGLDEAVEELADSGVGRLSRAERLILTAALLEDRLRHAATAAAWPEAGARVLDERAGELGPALRVYLRRRASAPAPGEPRASAAAALAARILAAGGSPASGTNAGGGSGSEPLALPVAHAGLVVLHPFLSPLLEATAMLNAGESRLSEAALPRAAALLHYLATGRDDVFEFDLGLVKVLLGLGPGTPLPVSPGLLDDADKQQADALAAAAVAHWNPREPLSVAELRRVFLQRVGFLRRDGRGWHLRVPHEPRDVQLDDLPWRLQPLQLPWMSQVLSTDWS
jgi:hypothetical protein